MRARSVDDRPLFIGIAPATDVEGWLTGVAHERVDSLSYGPFRTNTSLITGGASPGSPVGQPFWTVFVAGAGEQTLTWPSERGAWAVVLMNADARPGVAADVSVGAKTAALLPIGMVLGSFGLVLLAAGVAIMLAVLARTSGVSGTAAAGQLGGQASPPGTYPARLDARLEPRLSRWLWLVKWFLAIPHLVVLVLLWIAVAPLTVVAGIAILFTGRYPRAIFDFNLGVMRWGWRVAYYAFNALGTDRYPPFSLSSDPNYPADFTVDYPLQLSRGLVLVKWWLLAVPHYLVVAFFAGGWTAGVEYADNWRFAIGGGLIGVLVIVAAVVLLFSGHYPRSLFDFVMGMNRWCYRVMAYAMLLRDEYPPFRLDTGGTDPGSVPAPPPPGPSSDGLAAVEEPEPARVG